MRSLSLWPGYSLTILKMALSVGFRMSVSLHPATLATGLLTFTPVGLDPAVQTSLRWTHQFSKHSPYSSLNVNLITIYRDAFLFIFSHSQCQNNLRGTIELFRSKRGVIDFDDLMNECWWCCLDCFSSSKRRVRTVMALGLL